MVEPPESSVEEVSTRRRANVATSSVTSDGTNSANSALSVAEPDAIGSQPDAAAESGVQQEEGEEEARDRLVAHFQEVTGLSDSSGSRAVLAAADWNLDTAVNQVIHLADPDRSSSLSFSSASQSATTAAAPSAAGAVAAPSPLTGLLSWLVGWVRWPLQSLATAMAGVLRLCWSIVLGSGRSLQQPALPPADDVAQFVDEYERRYGCDHPTFFRGSYQQALSTARERLCFLLVYLHSWRHQDSAHFCRHVLNHEQLRAVCDDQLVVWACSVDRSEGRQVAVNLNALGHPFVGVIGIRAQWRMTLVGEVSPSQAHSQCLTDGAALLARLRQIMSDNEAWLVSARAERDELRLNQQLRQQQDQEYLLSLQADQEKERRRTEQLALQQQTELQLRREQEEHSTRLQQLQENRVRLAAKIPPEPSADEVKENTERFSRIQIKMPNGSRIERCFSRECSLSALYYVVFCHAEAPVNFEIAQNYPRRVLNCQPSDSGEPCSFSEAGLGQCEVLYVRDLDA